MRNLSIINQTNYTKRFFYQVIFDYRDEMRIVFDAYNPKNYQVICEKLDSQIKQRWNIDEIKIIEGLLFISMLPLHKDDLERQLALYSIGIQRLNEIFGNAS